MKKIAIVGASGHGKVVAEIAELNGYEEVVFFDDAFSEDILTLKSDRKNAGDTELKTKNLKPKTSFPWKVIGDTQALIARLDEFDACIVGIGNNAIRADKMKVLKNAAAPLVSLVHPSAVVSKYAEIGIGSVVMANAVVNPFVKAGEGCIINTVATIDHDCMLGDSVHVSPGANIGGAVEVGDQSWIGIGASVKQCLKLGSGVTVGAGAAVVSDIENGLTVVGVPARPLGR